MMNHVFVNIDRLKEVTFCEGCLVIVTWNVHPQSPRNNTQIVVDHLKGIFAFINKLKKKQVRKNKMKPRKLKKFNLKTIS